MILRARLKTIATSGGRAVVLAAYCGIAANTLTAQTPGRSSAVPSPSEIEKFEAATQQLRADHVEDAATAFQQIVQADSRFAEAWLNLGLAQAQLNKNAEAIMALEKAVGLKPTLHGAHLFLAITQYRLGRINAATAAVHKETALSPRDPQAWMWQGIIDLAGGRVPAAVDALNKAAQLDPTNVDILYHRGHAAFALSRQSYEEMFQADPKSWHVHQVLAQADDEAGKYADAVDQYRQAIAVAPPQSGLHESLGTALWQLGKFADAEAEFEEALRIDPSDIIATYKLGCLRVDLSKAGEAVPLLKQVLADPSLKMTRLYLGRANMQLGDLPAAIDNFKQVVREDVDPETTRQAYFQLSRAYRRQHQNAEASAAQAEYQRLDQAHKQQMQDRLEARRQRFDRDVTLPAPQEPAGEAAPE